MLLKIKEHGRTKRFSSKACLLLSPMDFCKLYELKIKPLILQKFLIRFGEKKTDKLCSREEGGGGGVLESIFAGYVPLASPNPYPIIVYSVANHRPHLSHF